MECNFHPKLLCSPRIRQDAQTRPELPQGCRWRNCSISRWKPVLDRPTAFSSRTGVLEHIRAVALDKVWIKPKHRTSGNVRESQDRPALCASCHFNVIFVTPPERNWRQKLSCQALWTGAQTSRVPHEGNLTAWAIKCDYMSQCEWPQFSLVLTVYLTML